MDALLLELLSPVCRAGSGDPSEVVVDCIWDRQRSPQELKGF